ncbi:RES domain-containing protein [Microbacterium sp. RURRCA19A]|nr:RES domain-containing protein [Microbacterium sp. RURRCA19A]
MVEPTVLRESFEGLLSIYEPDANGRPLPALLRGDWRLFTGSVMREDPAVKELLADILDDGEVVRKLYAPSEKDKGTSLAHWDDLRVEMMHGNRWFLKQNIDYDRLRELLNYLIVDPTTLSSTWHRARIISDDPYPLDKMGAPPLKKAGHGRANPAGIPYLYLGSTPATAVSEVRPHTGDVACVADFAVPTMKSVDLRDPRARISPFELNDDEVGQMHADLPLLERLGEELTRPVLPQGAPFEYVPSQHLCEFIKSCGFDGVVYRSSVSDGINVALFHPDQATPLRVSQYDVAKVEVHVFAQP